jgi:hypothetical protein
MLLCGMDLDSCSRGHIEENKAKECICCLHGHFPSLDTMSSANIALRSIARICNN